MGIQSTPPENAEEVAAKNGASLPQLLACWAVAAGERVFLSSPETGEDWSYAETHRRALAVAEQLRAAGVGPGQRVALVLENGLQWVAAFFGVLRAGAAAVPLNPALPAAELEKLARLAGARARLVEGGEPARLVVELLQEGAAESPGGVLDSVDENTPEVASKAAPGEALLLFTSGSTGEPKGVPLTHANLLAEAGFIRDGHRLGEGDTALCVLPFFHINGLVITLITTLFAGGRAVVPRRFSASLFWRQVADYRATWFSAVPTILTILLSRPRDPALDLSSLRFARSASAALPVAVLGRFEETFGVPVIEGYGLSEAGSQVAVNPLPPARRKPGSVGLPAGNELRVVDEQFRPAPGGVTGEVAVRGPNVTAGYWRNPEANAASFRDGWFLTGDLGFFDADGYLFLTGRKKELINRAGEKFSPREIDEVLHQLPAVELAAAVGVPDALYGEEVAAFLQLRPGAALDAEAVAAHCRGRLAEFKVPRRIFFVDDFPKGPNGKIQRSRLPEWHRSRAHRRAYSVLVSADGCKACGYCAEVCPRDVFAPGEAFNERGYRPVVAARPQDCVGCLRCFYACPDFSIDVEEHAPTGTGEAVALGEEAAA